MAPGEKSLLNEKGSKEEANVAMYLLLSLFRREENRDGDTYVPYHYTTTVLLLRFSFRHIV